MLEELNLALSREITVLLNLKAPESLPALAMSAKSVQLPDRPLPVTRYPAPPPMFRRTDDAARVLRIEVDHETGRDLVGAAMRVTDGFSLLRAWEAYCSGNTTGPMQYRGVDLYFVKHLPAPGWRIVNPMTNK